MLGEIYNSCYQIANSIKGWQKMNKNEIANLYLDNRHTESGSVYAAALLCKYWYKVGLIWKRNKSAMTQEDCYAIVWDGIEKAMDYAPWRNPTNTLYKDPNGPDKAINVCIDSVRKIYFTFTNRDKRKVNYGTNSVSADAFYDEYNDFIGDMLDDSVSFIDTETMNITVLINTFIKNNKLPEAIIIDNICYNDSTLINNDSAQVYSERKLVSSIHSLDVDEYSKYFSLQYGVDSVLVKDCINSINSLSYHLLHKLISRTLYMITNLEKYKYVY